MIFKNYIAIYYMNKELKLIYKIIKVSNEINKTLQNKIEDKCKKNRNIIMEVEILQNLYKEALITIK